MAQLGTKASGSIVKVNENGAPVNYIVVQQGLPSSIYDPSCDGTWLLRQDAPDDKHVWDADTNQVSGSDIMTYFNGTWLSRYDTEIRSAIKQVKIPYCAGRGSITAYTGASGLSCQVFPLSIYEVGMTKSIDGNGWLPNADGSKLSYFIEGSSASANQKRLAKTANGGNVIQWSRTPSTHDRYGIWCIDSSGGFTTDFCSVETIYPRPAMVLLADLTVTDDGTILTTLPKAPSISVPQQGMVGQPITVNWGTVNKADSYVLQRKSSADADWVQVYAGTGFTFSENAVSGWNSVQYRVQAVFGGTSAEWRTSSVIPISGLQTLLISGTDGDLGTLVNDVPFSAFTDTGNQIAIVCFNNGNKVFDGTVSSGTEQILSVLDLKTGGGKITLLASVQSAGGLITRTRHWTYTKSAATFPNAGSMSQLVIPEKNIWPNTLAQCVRLPGGNTLDTLVDKFPILTAPSTALYNLGARPNRNLLDNWYFGNPVNQRGQTSYNTPGYSIDRWYLQGGSFELSNNMLTFLFPAASGGAERFNQTIPLENFIRGVYTISILTTEGLYSVPFEYEPGNLIDVQLNIGNGIYMGFAGLENNSPRYRLFNANTSEDISVSIIATKLELGDHQTLAHQDEAGNWVLNEVPDYGEELAKCKRYYRRVFLDYLRFAHLGGSIARVSIPTEGMRVQPSATILGTPIVYSTENWATVAVTLSVNMEPIPDTVKNSETYVATISAGGAASADITATNLVLEFNAEL